MPRKENDFYPTPSWATEYLLDSLDFLRTASAYEATFYEPCVGDGDIERVLVERRYYPPITADLDSTHPADYHLDMAVGESWDRIAEVELLPEYVVTNPPFNQAARILPHAYTYCTVGVIALLRLTYLEPCENRRKFLYEHQDKLSILFLPKRVSFTGDGKTDSAATAWFIWGKHERLAPPFIYPKMGAKQLNLP